MTPKKRYGRKFGLPADQIRYYDYEELTEGEQVEVYSLFGGYKPDTYVYAVKRAGGLVWRRVER